MIAIIRHTIKRIREGLLKEMWAETKWIYLYVRHYWKFIILYTLLGLVGTVVSLGASFASRDLINIITGEQKGALITAFCTMIGFAIMNMFFAQLSSYASNWISLKVDTEIKADIFDKMLVTDWESITAYHTGDLLVRWSTDASSISSGVLTWVPNLIITLFRFISAFAVVIYNDWTFALFAFISIPFTALMSRRLMRRMVNNNKRSAAMNAKMSGFNQETFSNLQTIKAFGLVRLYVKRLRQLQSEYISMRLEFQRMSMATSILMSLIGLLVSYSSYGWGIYRVWSGVIDYGTMTLFLSMSSTLTTTLDSLISVVPDAINLTTSAGRLMDILNMPKENYDDDDAVAVYAKAHHDEGLSLCIDDVDYTYHTGTLVFARASMEAHPHEIVALVGPSGEGKTTLLRLILSLLMPQSGSMYLSSGANGMDTISLSPSTRRLFAYVPQGNTMFSGTIAENMRNLKEDATDNEIIEALQIACAWEFVSKLPDGINSEIKERGGGFSEGQAQRLSIARALLRQSPILLLDEATSALDVATERKVLKNIMKDTYPRTCIVTTHRPSVLTICNRIYAIRNQQCHILNEDEVNQLLDEF